MPRGRGRGQGAAAAGKKIKPRCARSLAFTNPANEEDETREEVVAVAGPSGEQSRTLSSQLKAYKIAKSHDAKNEAKLSPGQRQRLADLRQAKQVGNFRMPDAPEPKKGKGKGKGTGTEKVWIPCPLLPGVPAVPPPRVPQPWEIKRSLDIIEEEEEDDVIEGTPPPYP